jgi:hypothetical protein
MILPFLFQKDEIMVEHFLPVTRSFGSIVTVVGGFEITCAIDVA